MAEDASACVQAHTGPAPQINGVTPQIGHLQAQVAPSKAQKAGILAETPLQETRAHGIQLQSHG